MEDYITKDYLRAEVNTLRADVRADLSDLSDKLTNQFNGMMMKTIFAILIPIILLLLGLFAKL